MKLVFTLVFCALLLASGCSEKPTRISGLKVELAPPQVLVRTTQPHASSMFIWGVATDDKIKTGGAASSEVLLLKAESFALQMIGFLYGAEAFNSSSGISVTSRGAFSSAGLSINDKSMIYHSNTSAIILRLDAPRTDTLHAEQALASISFLTPVFVSSGGNKSFQSRFDAALNGKIKDKMNSLGLNRCIVYLNSMDYDEKEGIRAEFSLFKSNTP